MGYITCSGSCRNTSHDLDRNDAAFSVGAVLTAVPVGRAWRIKAIAQSGEITLLGRFDGRLAALGAGVLLAERCGGRVLP